MFEEPETFERLHREQLVHLLFDSHLTSGAERA